MAKSLKRVILEELRSVSELVKPDEINLSSFTMRNALNPKIWVSEKKINPKVRKQLLKIADDFIEFLDIPFIRHLDITITGSLANYNWSSYSDVDMHVIYNFAEINDNEEMVADFLDSKRKIWNDTHDIKIHGFEVELYCQDENQEHYSSGVYSLESDSWLIEPNKVEPNLDKRLIKKKAAEIMSQMDEIVEIYETGDFDEVLDQYEILWDKVKTMRKAGLEREGEFSYENMVFKVLRRSGYVEKFMEIKTNAYDALHSI